MSFLLRHPSNFGPEKPQLSRKPQAEAQLLSLPSTSKHLSRQRRTDQNVCDLIHAHDARVLTTHPCTRHEIAHLGSGSSSNFNHTILFFRRNRCISQARWGLGHHPQARCEVPPVLLGNAKSRRNSGGMCFSVPFCPARLILHAQKQKSSASCTTCKTQKIVSTHSPHCAQ